MIVKANRRNLQKFARVLLGSSYTPETERELIREAMKGPEPSPWWVHRSHEQGAHLDRLNVILRTHGVEGMIEPDIQYCNQGDTYSTTLLYWDGDLYIGDWGSIVEEADCRHDY